MKALTIIKKHIEDRNISFVFPSEITARFWLKKSFEYTKRSAVPLKRFLSWDEFKKTVVEYSTDKRPVNQALRTLFTCRVLEENRRAKTFKQIINPEYADTSFVFLKAIRKILPTLHHIKQFDFRTPLISESKRDDLYRLRQLYSHFLNTAGLFEPNFEKPILKLNDRRYILFYPEVIEDYSGFEDPISVQPEIKVIHFDGISPGIISNAITVFENSIQEIKWVLLKVGELLDRHVDPEQIVLTVAELNQLESHLKREAELYEIPLKIHSGKPITAYPEARLFGQIKECVESSFSLKALKTFLLNCAIPWKEPRPARDLVRVGTDYKILKNFTGYSQKTDDWQKNLIKAQNCHSRSKISIKALQSFYGKLKTHLMQIYLAEDFQQLKSFLTTFSITFLETSDWEEDQLKIFQFALNSLDELIEASGTADGRIEILPFLLWLKYLDERIYVKKDSSCGIPVYPYRLASGVYPDHHFILNASQNGTAHLVRNYPFLSIHEEANLSTTEKDFSQAHILLYSLSGAEVRFSYSRKSFYDTHLPPAYFVTQGSIQPFSLDDHSRDPYEAERKSWVDGSLPELILPVQKEGLDSALHTILSQKSSDFAMSPIKDERLIKQIQKNLADKEAHLRITPTNLELFRECPFHFLLEKGLGLKVETYQVLMFEPWEFGQIMHKVFQNFYEKIKDSEKTLKLEPHRREYYQELIRSAVDSALKEYGDCGPVPIQPIWEEIRRKATELACEYIDVEIEEMPDVEILFTEKWLDLTWQSEKIHLLGKIDRISRKPSGYILVDYKKRNIPRKNDIFGPDPISFQMPFYIYLMNENKMNVAQAAFYSVENKRYIYVVSTSEGKKAMAGLEELGEKIEDLKVEIQEMACSIRKGQFMTPGQPGEDECRYCSFREICRDKYVLKP